LQGTVDVDTHIDIDTGVDLDTNSEGGILDVGEVNNSGNVNGFVVGGIRLPFWLSGHDIFQYFTSKIKHPR